MTVVWATPFFMTAQAHDDIFAPYREQGIVVAQESDMAPMSFVEVNGKPKGFIIDLWRKWSAETGIPVSFKLSAWADSLQAVRDGDADVHGGLFFTPERDSFLDYTLPFFPSQGALFVKYDSKIRKVSDLQGKLVGVIDKSFYESQIAEIFPEFRPVPIRTSAELVEAAAAGKVDGFLADYPTLMYQIGAMGKGREFKVIKFVTLQEFRAAVAEGNYALLEVVEEGLALIDSDERRNILNRWIVGNDYKTRPWLLPLVIASFVGLILAAILPFIWGRRKP